MIKLVEMSFQRKGIKNFLSVHKKIRLKIINIKISNKSLTFRNIKIFLFVYSQNHGIE